MDKREESKDWTRATKQLINFVRCHKISVSDRLDFLAMQLEFTKVAGILYKCMCDGKKGDDGARKWEKANREICDKLEAEQKDKRDVGVVTDECGSVVKPVDVKSEFVQTDGVVSRSEAVQTEHAGENLGIYVGIAERGGFAGDSNNRQSNLRHCQKSAYHRVNPVPACPEFAYSPRRRFVKESRRCHFCHKLGHIVVDCRHRNRSCFYCGDPDHLIASCHVLARSGERLDRYSGSLSSGLKVRGSEVGRSMNEICRERVSDSDSGQSVDVISTMKSRDSELSERSSEFEKVSGSKKSFCEALGGIEEDHGQRHVYRIGGLEFR